MQKVMRAPTGTSAIASLGAAGPAHHAQDRHVCCMSISSMMCYRGSKAMTESTVTSSVMVKPLDWYHLRSWFNCTTSLVAWQANSRRLRGLMASEKRMNRAE